MTHDKETSDDSIAVMSASEKLLIVEQFRALRAEIQLRIAMQNLLLIIFCCMLAALLIVSLVTREVLTLVILNVLAMICSSMWAHHMCRTAQIRAYMLSVIEPALFERIEGWESWLDKRHFKSILGSRWFVSTKGIFMMSQGLTVPLFFLWEGEQFLLSPVLTLVMTWWITKKPPLCNKEEKC